jgi:hypothetical protein
VHINWGQHLDKDTGTSTATATSSTSLSLVECDDTSTAETSTSVLRTERSGDIDLADVNLHIQRRGRGAVMWNSGGLCFREQGSGCVEGYTIHRLLQGLSIEL